MTYIIGIAGGSGSGKTTIANSLKEKFPEDVTLISLDDYYKDRRDNEIVNFDHPSSIDLELFEKDLSKIANGESIRKPKYDFIKSIRDGFEIIEPNKIIIVEGLYALYTKEIRKNYALKLFVDIDSDLRLIRRLKRDMEERKRSFDNIINQYIDQVREMHQLHIEPQKFYAELILSNENKNNIAVDILSNKLNSILNN